jgi:hypothetical protein
VAIKIECGREAVVRSGEQRVREDTGECAQEELHGDEKTEARRGRAGPSAGTRPKPYALNGSPFADAVQCSSSVVPLSLSERLSLRQHFIGWCSE